MPDTPRLEELRRRVERDPASIAFAALAEEYRRAGRLHDAIATCRTGLRRHPVYLSARVTLGRALVETGEYEAARREIEYVLRMAPDNLAAIQTLEEVDRRAGLPAGSAVEASPPAASDAASVPAPAPLPIPVLTHTRGPADTLGTEPAARGALEQGSPERGGGPEVLAGLERLLEGIARARRNLEASDSR